MDKKWDKKIQIVRAYPKLICFPKKNPTIYAHEKYKNYCTNTPSLPDRAVQ